MFAPLKSFKIASLNPEVPINSGKGDLLITGVVVHIRKAKIDFFIIISRQYQL